MGGLANSRLRSAQAGISLVETLVALVLGLTMVSVALNLQTSNRAVSGQIQAMVRLQESAGIAAALLETNLRHAGGTLCRNNPPTTTLLNTRSLASYVDYQRHAPEKPYAYWEYIDGGGLLGIHGYESTTSDPIVGDSRKAGDSISIMSDNMGAIVDIQINRLRKLLADRKIEIEISDAARNWLAEKGYDPAYGARPLKRVIQKNLQDPLAEELLAGRIKDGDKVNVDVKAGLLTFNGLPVGGKVIDPKVVQLH